MATETKTKLTAKQRAGLKKIRGKSWNSFNENDGVADFLAENPDMWVDLSFPVVDTTTGEGDTLYLQPAEGQEKYLASMAVDWDADEAAWVTFTDDPPTLKGEVLYLWWD